MEDDDYQITFRIIPFFGTWTWSAMAPDGRQLNPFGLGYISKEAAESSALEHMERDRATETISRRELDQRVNLRERDEGRERAERAESAARDFAKTLVGVLDHCEFARVALAVHPGWEPDRASRELRNPTTAHYTQDND